MLGRYWEEIWSRGDLDFVADFYADPYRENDEEMSVAAFRRNVLGTRGQFPDFTARLVAAFSCGDRVVSRVVFSATHPPTGRRFDAPGLDVFRFKDGKVVEHWHVSDHAEVYRQLGVELKLPEA